MPTFYCYVPTTDFEGGYVQLHRVFCGGSEDNTGWFTVVPVGDGRGRVTFTQGCSADVSTTVEIWHNSTWQACTWDGASAFEYTEPVAATEFTGLGDCADCTCGSTACDRRATAYKRWGGWFRWDADPTASLYTTRYRKQTITYTYTVGPEAFVDDGNYAYIDSTYTPSGSDVLIGSTVGCDSAGNSTVVNLYDTAGGDPANYTFWPGGTYTRVTVNEIARHEPISPGPTPNYITITEEGVEVYSWSLEHPGACLDCSGVVEVTNPSWATLPPQLPGYDLGPCTNFLKYILDNQIGMTLDSSVISGDGLTKTDTYSGTFPGTGTSTVSASIVSVLSDPYTLADCMTDADTLLAEVPTDGSIVFDTHCTGTAIVMGCFGWPVAGSSPRTNDLVIFEDAICSIPQAYNVGYMASDVAVPLDDDVAAQRMVYDTGTDAYCVVTRSWWLWGVGHSRTTLLTTTYSKPTNVTESVTGTSSTTPTYGVEAVIAPASYPSLEIQTLEP